MFFFASQVDKFLLNFLKIVRKSDAGYLKKCCAGGKCGPQSSSREQLGMGR